MKKLFGLLMAGAMVCSLTACDSDDDGGNSANNPYTNIPMEEGTRAVTAQANDFAFKLFNTTDFNAEQNACLSPYSLFVALSMTANGDDGETSRQLRNILGVGEGSLEDLNSYNRTLMEYLPKVDRQSVCKLPVCIWYDPDLRLTDSFKSAVTGYYAGSLKDISPKGENGMNAINDWVKKNTEGLIPKFLKAPLDVNVALVNAAYFKAKWKEKFNKENTAKEDFHNADGSTTKVDMMHTSGQFNYAEIEGMRILELAYGNSNFAMDLILPEEGKTLNETLAKLDSNLFTSIMSYIFSEISFYKVHVGLPRFNGSTDTDMLDTLQKMGLSSLELNSIAKDQLITINKILQSTYINVDEEGTEAAAATIVGGCASAGPIDEVTMTLDRPFLYIIRERSTGTILFMGQQVKF